MLKILLSAAAFRTVILEIKGLFLSSPCFKEVWTFLFGAAYILRKVFVTLAFFTKFVSE